MFDPTRLSKSIRVRARPKSDWRLSVYELCVRCDNETTSRTISELQPVANGFIIKLVDDVEQEGDDMRGIHRLLSHIPRNLFDASSVLL